MSPVPTINSSLYSVRAMNPTHNDGVKWHNILVNTDKIAYVEILDEGDLKGHVIVGFDYREYICHRDDVKLLFEI